MKEIQVTSDYSLFSNHPKNRNPVEAHVNILMGKIQDNNHLDVNPIIVTEGGKESLYYVTNGMHRLLAAKKLGLPIYFIVKSLDSGDVCTLNTAKAWTDKDWLEFYIDIPDYQYVKSFMEKYKITLGSARVICGLKESKMSKWRAGEFRATDIESSRKIAQSIMDIQDNVHPQKKPLLRATRFIDMLVLASKMDFCLDNFVDQAISYPHLITKSPDRETAKQVITNIYNHNARKRKRFYFA